MWRTFFIIHERENISIKTAMSYTQKFLMSDHVILFPVSNEENIHAFVVAGFYFSVV